MVGGLGLGLLGLEVSSGLWGLGSGVGGQGARVLGRRSSVSRALRLVGSGEVSEFRV